MDEETPHIDVRAVHTNDAPALYELDYDFETDRIYTLRMRDCLLQSEGVAGGGEKATFAFELIETSVDPPIYKNYRDIWDTLAKIEARLQSTDGGYIALADGQVAGGILLRVEEWRSVAYVEELIVGRQFRRYGIGSLLLSCASDWARERDCWAIVLETQNINYPAIQFYLRNDLEVWGISRHFYPPGPLSHEIAIFMGKRLSSS